jgi:hypothetical protein
MATENQVKRILKRALGLANNTLDAQLNPGEDLVARIDNT